MNFDPAPFLSAAEQGPFATIRHHSDRFPSWGRLKRRFERCRDALRSEGRGALEPFIEVHNELTVAASILSEGDPPFCTRLEYEEPLASTGKRFDFTANLLDGLRRNVEVKTIHPATQDDWEKFSHIRNSGLLPENVILAIHRDWMGGEFWHNWFASRSRMLEYTLETERKISQSGRSGEMMWVSGRVKATRSYPGRGIRGTRHA